MKRSHRAFSEYEMLNFGLDGKVVIVTGGASGIGLATARSLVKDGAKVMILDMKEDGVAAALDELRIPGADIQGAALDIRDEAALQSALVETERSLGTPFGLVACAGTSTASPAEVQGVEEWERVLSVNATGTFRCCRIFGARMLQAGEGAIVVIGSVSGLGAQAGRVAYATSKFAVNGLVKSLALEWGQRNVRVNCIAPTLVDTPMLRANLPPSFVSSIVDRTPMARIAASDDIALTAMALLSDATAFVNGAILPVDGGLTAGYMTRNNGRDLSSNLLLEKGLYDE
jgi:NAD(P)-dependent dehydrogenase (short-subunit alcohol dehydrogenase family)